MMLKIIFVLLFHLEVFRGGEGALQVLPNLVDVIPEARLNLVIYHLKQNDIREAFELIKDLEPAVPQEYILKGIVNAVMGQETGSVSFAGHHSIDDSIITVRNI